MNFRRGDAQLVLVLPLLSVGCATTQKDFAAMSVSDRQRAVCYGSNAFKQRKEQLSLYKTEIEKKLVSLALFNGFVELPMLFNFALVGDRY